MIRNEAEYTEAALRLKAEEERLTAHRKALAAQGYRGERLERLMAPLTSFHLQLREEVESYERLRRGELAELTNLRGLGHALICLRIASDVTQAKLAERLGVSPSQVSRDERNEYHGITLDRAAKILDALGAKVRMSFEIEPQEVAAAG
jgi:DNA-binding XRE family transcriptional regulator